MRVYIDEAGPFVVPTSAQPLFSLVLAVVVPSCVEQALFAEFSVLRDGWSNQGGEVKGSKLDESQAAQLIELASRYDVFVNFFAIDMTRHDDAVVSAYKSRQADAVTAGLRSEHNPEITAQLQGLADAIRRVPNQLFLQASLMIDLVLKVIEDSTLYYVQRVPAELGSIAWVIDRKNRTITEMGGYLVDSGPPDERKPLCKNAPALPSRGRPLAFRRTLQNRRERPGDDPPCEVDAGGLRHSTRRSPARTEFDASPERAAAVRGLGGLSRAAIGRHARRDLAACAKRPPSGSRMENFGRLLIADRRTPFLQFGEPDGRSQRMHGQVEKVWPALKTGNNEMLVRR